MSFNNLMTIISSLYHREVETLPFANHDANANVIKIEKWKTQFRGMMSPVTLNKKWRTKREDEVYKTSVKNKLW
jgi:hypothetical protein